jgi:hypothetical protein
MGFPPYDQDPLQLASECLRETADSPDLRRKQRQLLALLAVELIQRFRAEEAGLLQMKSPSLKRCREENHRMARQLRTLMGLGDLGLAIEPGLRTLIEAWRRHQQRSWKSDDRNHRDWGVTS